MIIGYDAKRVYQNNTGLGNYSRTLVTSLAQYFPENKYLLFAPKKTGLFSDAPWQNIQSIYPQSFLSSKIKPLWRSRLMLKDIVAQQVQLYHGLSAELPQGLRATNIKAVVTIHDLIYERYPGQYKKIDRLLYRHKAKAACHAAHSVIAISSQTKDDLINIYKIPAEKITVCYQSCNPAFSLRVSDDEKLRIKNLYGLPQQYLLTVGSIIERKNLLTLCKALRLLPYKDVPLVVIGNGGAYKQQVKQYLAAAGMQQQVIFLNECAETLAASGFASGADFPAIYQMAAAFIYPSVFEGFGIPILEAMCSGVPVVTTNVSCMPETAGGAALYFSPHDEAGLAERLRQVLNDNLLAEEMIQKGFAQAQKFAPDKCAEAVMHFYKKLV